MHVPLPLHVTPNNLQKNCVICMRVHEDIRNFTLSTLLRSPNNALESIPSYIYVCMSKQATISGGRNMKDLK